MNKTISIILLICLHLQAANNGYVFMDYLLNKDYIKAFLCVNKERPKLQCEGKCYLMQQLQKNEPKQRDELPVLEQLNLEFILGYTFFQNGVVQMVFKPSQAFFHYILGDYASKLQNVFHPPRS